MALRWKPPREGLERLDAELQALCSTDGPAGNSDPSRAFKDLTLEERMRTASCAKCFEALARDYPQQPFSELQEAYAMLEDFRQSNDLLAATQAAAQWKEHREAQTGVLLRRSMKATCLQGPDPVEPALRMPKAVVSRSEWFAPSTPQVQPSGVSFLSGLTTRRIQPSETGSLSWGRPYFEPTMFSSGRKGDAVSDDFDLLEAVQAEGPFFLGKASAVRVGHV
eukprot:g31571.t1